MIHASYALKTLGIAIFALATVLAALYLVEERNLKRKRFHRVLFRRGIALETIDKLSHRLIVIGFPIFTVSMMLGVVWLSQRTQSPYRAEYSLSAVTWASFAALIVLRTMRGWRGRKAAWLTISGFTAAVVVLILYLARGLGA